MSQNYTLIGCLAKAGQDQDLRLSPKKHILFWKSFLTRNIVSLSKQLSMPGKLDVKSHFLKQMSK